MDLKEALQDAMWREHLIGDTYSMINVGGKKDVDKWKIAYYPLFGTYKGENDSKVWIEFEEPRALVEKQIDGGTDFREVPLRYLSKNINIFVGKVEFGEFIKVTECPKCTSKNMKWHLSSTKQCIDCGDIFRAENLVELK